MVHSKSLKEVHTVHECTAGVAGRRKVRRGRLLDAHKGLPMPKSQKDFAGQQFLELYHNSGYTLIQFFLALGYEAEAAEDALHFDGSH